MPSIKTTAIQPMSTIIKCILLLVVSCASSIVRCSSLFPTCDAFQPSYKCMRSSFTSVSSLYDSPPTSTSNTQQPELLDPKATSLRVFESDKRPIILFDGVCNLCNNAVNLALDWDPKGKLRFSALQSNVGRALLETNGRKPDDISSIVLVTQDGAYVKSDAILKITEELTPLSLLPLKPAAVLGRYVVPKFLRDIIYDGVADNRYDLMGKKNECRFDADGEFEDRFVDDSLACI